jgi:SAM-dependent methyltransferase
MDVKKHYDMLIDEDNDPFRDPPILQEYMNKWDGEIFLDALKLDKKKNVLEIGIGTGRIAAKTAPNGLNLTGIDISPKTVERAKDNLKDHPNISFICDDFYRHQFEDTFDIIYSSLTMMHFEDKKEVISKVDKLLNKNGTFCLSIDKDQSEYIDMQTRKIKIFPDTCENIVSLIEVTDMTVSDVFETENAYIIVSNK